MELAKKIERRHFLKLSLGLAGTAVLAACAPAAKPEAPAAEPQGQTGASEPTQAPAASEAKDPAKVQDNIVLRVGGYLIADRDWYIEAPKWWAEEYPGVTVEVESIVYAESMTKALTGMATGTLPDVFSAPNRWGPYAAYKGVFMFLDEFVEAKDPDLNDIFDAVIDGASFEGKMYGIPNQLHPGRPTCVFYNKNLLAEAGVDEPTDDWTCEQFSEMAGKITNHEKRVFGSAFLPTNYHDFVAMARTMGGDALSDDAKTSLISTDQGAIAAARWQVDLKTVYDAVPGREEGEGLNFQAGVFGFWPQAVNVMKGLEIGIGDKFEWDVVLAPKGPGGLLGAASFVDSVCLAHNTKYPNEGYDLAVYLNSYDLQKRVMTEYAHNPCRKSLYLLEGMPSIWKRTHDWLVASKAKSTFPIPYNLLFEEVVDTFTNNSLDLWMGDVDFDEGLQRLNDEVQKVLDKPRA